MEPVARATGPRLRTGPGQNHEEARAQLPGLALTPSLRSPSSTHASCFPGAHPGLRRVFFSEGYHLLRDSPTPLGVSSPGSASPHPEIHSLTLVWGRLPKSCF